MSLSEGIHGISTRFKGLRLLPACVAFSVFACVAVSCSDDNKSTIGNVDPEVFPTMSTKDVSTLVSDSGYTRYHLTTDLWLMFDEAKDPHWTFPTGIFMERYNDSMDVEATFRSDSASYLSQKRIWRFDGNVRMRNVDGDRFATEQLFWDQSQQKVYSDSFIHIERTDRILEGYGFVSNEEMTEYTILSVSGIFPTPQKKEHAEPTDSANREPDSVATPIEQSARRRAAVASRNERKAEVKPKAEDSEFKVVQQR